MKKNTRREFISKFIVAAGGLAAAALPLSRLLGGEGKEATPGSSENEADDTISFIGCDLDALGGLSQLDEHTPRHDWGFLTADGIDIDHHTFVEPSTDESGGVLRFDAPDTYNEIGFGWPESHWTVRLYDDMTYAVFHNQSPYPVTERRKNDNEYKVYAVLKADETHRCRLKVCNNHTIDIDWMTAKMPRYEEYQQFWQSTPPQTWRVKNDSTKSS